MGASAIRRSARTAAATLPEPAIRRRRIPRAAQGEECKPCSAPQTCGGLTPGECGCAVDDPACICQPGCASNEVCLTCGGVSACQPLGSGCCVAQVCGPNTQCLVCSGDPAGTCADLDDMLQPKQLPGLLRQRWNPLRRHDGCGLRLRRCHLGDQCSSPNTCENQSCGGATKRRLGAAAIAAAYARSAPRTRRAHGWRELSELRSRKRVHGTKLRGLHVHEPARLYGQLREIWLRRYPAPGCSVRATGATPAT